MRGSNMSNKMHIMMLTHWGRVTHICVSKLIIIASDNGLSPGRRQAIIWTSAGILLIGPLGTNFSEIWIEIITFSFKKMRLKLSSAKLRPFGFGLNVFKYLQIRRVEAACYAAWLAWRFQLDIGSAVPYNFWRWPSWIFKLLVNTLRPRQDGRHFPDDIFKCIFLYENVWISIKISLKFVPKGPINNIPALV